MQKAVIEDEDTHHIRITSFLTFRTYSRSIPSLIRSTAAFLVSTLSISFGRLAAASAQPIVACLWSRNGTLSYSYSFSWMGYHLLLKPGKQHVFATLSYFSHSVSNAAAALRTSTSERMRETANPPGCGVWKPQTETRHNVCSRSSSRFRTGQIRARLGLGASLSHALNPGVFALFSGIF